MDDSKKSKGKNSSALPVLDPVSATARVGVTPTDKESTDRTQADSGLMEIVRQELRVQLLDCARLAEQFSALSADYSKRADHFASLAKMWRRKATEIGKALQATEAPA